VHLDAGYDYRPCRDALDQRGMVGEIAHAHPGGPAVGGRARQLLAGRLRQAPTLHRTPPGLRRRLPRFGRSDRRPPCPAPRRLVPLPMGHPTTITANPLSASSLKAPNRSNSERSSVSVRLVRIDDVVEVVAAQRVLQAARQDGDHWRVVAMLGSDLAACWRPAARAPEHH
jgi:hypothetical protein